MAVTPFLMFEGRAQEAIDLYVQVIPRTTLQSIAHFPPEAALAAANGPDPAEYPPVQIDEPLVMMAVLDMDGISLRLNDSPIHHKFTFTPASSLYFETGDLSEYEKVLAGLSEGGEFLMEDSDQYGFAPRYAWLNDRFGVSWQISLSQ